MKIRFVALVCLLACSVSSASFSSLTKKELDLKYAFNETRDWESVLQTTLTPAVKDYLNQGRYQEAIWLLEEAEEEASASQVKEFLRNILEQSPFQPEGVIALGGGVTETKLVYLTHGVKAVFKVKSSHPSSDFRSEVGAYLVDQLGKFALVPMTVFRHQGTKVGSLQYFVEGTKDARKMPDYKKSAQLNVFDYLIRNQDRTAKNILLLNNREIAIDHGLALRSSFALGDFLRATDLVRQRIGLRGDFVRMHFLLPKGHETAFRAHSRILSALHQLSSEHLVESLSGVLSEERIQMIWRKKTKLLKLLEAES